MHNCRTLILLAALLSPMATAQPVEIHDCDRAAAHPSDPDRVTDGVSSGSVVTHRAIPACRAAVDAHPEVARFHYQLGRAIVYWAGANGADYSEGMTHLRRAAEMDHTQALFVLGLMLTTEGKICDAEPLTRRAAEKGLKSARLTYVDHVTADRWRDCEVTANLVEMRAYLDGAASQVDGYYETMLLDSLRRQLERLGET